MKLDVACISQWKETRNNCESLKNYDDLSNSFLKRNGLSDKLIAALNVKRTKEVPMVQIFLSYPSWADRYGYAGISNLSYS